MGDPLDNNEISIEVDRDVLFKVEFDDIKSVTSFVKEVRAFDESQGKPVKQSYMRFTRKEFSEILNQYFTTDDLLALCNVTKDDFNNQLKFINCTRCRSAVEAIFMQFTTKTEAESSWFVLDHLLANQGNLSLDRSVLQDPKELYEYIFTIPAKKESFFETLKITKKNSKCVLHQPGSGAYKCENPSLNSLGFFGRGKYMTRDTLKKAWKNVWRKLPFDCRQEICRIEKHKLRQTIDRYLERYHFCDECSAQVLSAFEKLCTADDGDVKVKILDGKPIVVCNGCKSEMQPDEEKKRYVFAGSDLDSDSDTEEEHKCCDDNYNPLIYRGLDFEDGFIQVSHNTADITILLTRAEREILSFFDRKKDEKHAKSMARAQYEVLVCIGIHLFQRLDKIWYGNFRNNSN